LGEEIKSEEEKKEVDEDLVEEIKSEEEKKEVDEEIINNKSKYSKEPLKKIINNISCQNYVTVQNKTYCWDGNKFFPFENKR